LKVGAKRASSTSAIRVSSLGKKEEGRKEAERTEGREGGREGGRGVLVQSFHQRGILPFSLLPSSLPPTP